MSFVQTREVQVCRNINKFIERCISSLNVASRQVVAGIWEIPTVVQLSCVVILSSRRCDHVSRHYVLCHFTFFPLIFLLKFSPMRWGCNLFLSSITWRWDHEQCMPGADPGEVKRVNFHPLFLSPLLSFSFFLSLKYWLVLVHYYKNSPPHFKILDPHL